MLLEALGAVPCAAFGHGSLHKTASEGFRESWEPLWLSLVNHEDMDPQNGPSCGPECNSCMDPRLMATTALLVNKLTCVHGVSGGLRFAAMPTIEANFHVHAPGC